MGTDKLIENSLQYIEEHLEEISTVAEIAAAVGYSEFYFSRRFRNVMQLSVMEYVKKRRLIRASDAILSGDKIIDVALRFGWQTHGGFTKSFKQEFGFCPALLKAIVMEFESLGGSVMSHVFYTKTDVHATKEQLFELLRTEIKNAGIRVDQVELEQIYADARNVYSGIARYSGDEYVTHPLNVAIILAQMNADADTIYAGLFWDAVQKTLVNIDELRDKLPEMTVSILEKAGESNLDDENVDDEVILVKLAGRLHNMRTLDYLSEEKRVYRAKETLEMILPLVKRVNHPKLMDELNDLSMKYLHDNK